VIAKFFLKGKETNGKIKVKMTTVIIK